MPHCFLDGDQICTGFVKMQSEGMTQRVQVEAISRQAACLQLMDKDVVDRLLTDMGISFLSGEEPVFGFRTSVSSSDIGDEQIISFIGQDGVPVGAVLAAGDIDTVFGMVDIAAVQAAEFADTDPGRIQECDLSFVLRIGNGVNDSVYLLSGRNSRQGLVEMQEGNLPFILVFVKDIVKEIMQLSDMDVDGTRV